MEYERNWADTYEDPQPKKKTFKKPHGAVRFLLQVLSFVLFFALVCATVTAALVADLRQATSQDGIKQLVTCALEGDGETAPLKEELVEILVESLIQEEIETGRIDKEQVRQLVEEPTIMEFVIDKASGYVDDFISGENNTEITTEEIMKQLEENKELLEACLGREINESDMEAFATAAEDAGIELRQEIMGNGDDPQSGEIHDIMEKLRQVISDQAMYSILGICLAIAVFLLLGNYYSIPGGLGWISSAVILAGGLLSAPVYLVLNNREQALAMLELEKGAAAIFFGMVEPLASIHYTVLGIGVAVAVASIAWRIVRASRNK